jgi:hypothetical protein
VIALPDWNRPRLLVPAATAAERWRGSGFYPAFRLTARAYRWLLRLKALGGPGVVRTSRDFCDGATLQDFLADVIPGAKVVAVVVGMASRAQKLTAQLSGADGRVTGYLKCAASDLARERLRNEHDLLQLLPPGAGPRPLRFGAFAGMTALLTQAVSGCALPLALVPPPELLKYALSLHTPDRHAVQHHPWLCRQGLTMDPELSAIAGALTGREWPVVRLHGDLVPWNLLRRPTGQLAAIDWEYGCTEGFPGIDLVQYVLQVAVLIHHWDPARTRAFATRCLLDCGLDATVAEADAIVRLAAYHAFRNTALDGWDATDRVQSWRRTLWRGHEDDRPV